MSKTGEAVIQDLNDREELCQAVREMRAYQKSYFANRDYGVLLLAKEAERRVDELIDAQLTFDFPDTEEER